MPSINSAQYAQRIIQTESHESPSFLRKVHRLDPPSCDAHFTPKLKQPMAAFDINSPSAALGFGIGKLGSPIDVLRLAFSPVLYAIGYTLCFASIWTVCSEVSG